MQRAAFGRHRFVREPARQVERFARRQRDFTIERQRRYVRAAVQLLRLERQLDQRFVDPPNLGAFDLNGQRIVRVVMDVESLGAGRRQVDVRTDEGAEIALQPVARALQPRAHECRIFDDQRVAALEEP